MKRLLTLALTLIASCTLSFAQTPQDIGTNRGQELVLTIVTQNENAFGRTMDQIVEEIRTYKAQGEEPFNQYWSSLNSKFMATCKEYGASGDEANSIWNQLATPLLEAAAAPATPQTPADNNSVGSSLEEKGKELGTKCIETLMQGGDGEVVVAEIVKYAKSHCKSEAELKMFTSGVADGIYESSDKYEFDEDAAVSWVEAIESQLYE